MTMKRNEFFKTAIGLLAFGEVCEHLATPPIKWTLYKCANGTTWKMQYSPLFDSKPGVGGETFTLKLHMLDFALYENLS